MSNANGTNEPKGLCMRTVEVSIKDLGLDSDDIVYLIGELNLTESDVKLILQKVVRHASRWDDVIQPVIEVINEELNSYKQEIAEAISK